MLRKSEGRRRSVVELMLVTPGEPYRPALRLDTEELRDAYEEGRRDAGRGTEAIVANYEAHEARSRDARRAYVLGVQRGPCEAPPALPVDVALFALNAVLIVAGSRVHGLRQALVKGPALIAVAMLGGLAQRHTRRDRARRLGLTVLSAPQRQFHPSLFLQALAAVVYGRHRRRRGTSERGDWSLMLARSAVGRITERVSWRRARCAKPNHGSRSRSLASWR